MKKNVYMTFLSVLTQRLYREIVRPALPYIAFAISGLLLSFAIGLAFYRAGGWGLANIMIITLRGMITIVAIAALGVALYCTFIVFPDWLMSIWREAKRKSKSE